MITQVLNRQFVLEQLDDVRQELPRLSGTTGKLSEADLTVAANDLGAAQLREDATSSGQKGYDDDLGARRGQEPAPLDDTAFVSHDRTICNLQSALTAYFEDHAPEKLEGEANVGDDRRSDDFVAVAEQGLVDCELEPRDDERRVFNKFSETDPRWVASLFAMGTSLVTLPHPFNEQPSDPLRISNDARLILVADWGTGLPRAAEVGRQMRKIFQQGVEAGIEQHVVHLGDVYYSGWEREYRQYFLPYWPIDAKAAGDRARSWCLNGNHDMFSGGWGYFDFLLADPRFARQQRSSFFSFYNDDWNILGLDTAYDDAGLRDPQAKWLTDTVIGSPRRSMLLSHHQLFSAYDGPSKPLQAKLDDFLRRRPIDVWFWGHEHRCVFYNQFQSVDHARLIGHGGVPVYMTHREDGAHEPPSFYEYRKFISSGLERWAYLGFAVVDFAGRRANVRYINEFGTTYYTETL